MSENNAGWNRNAEISCDNESCDFTTTSGKEAMQHAYATAHSLTGEGPFKGSVMTVRLERDEPDEDKEERQSMAFSMLREARKVPPTVGEGFSNYCNVCGGENGRHTYHCNNDR